MGKTAFLTATVTITMMINQIFFCTFIYTALAGYGYGHGHGHGYGYGYQRQSQSTPTGNIAEVLTKAGATTLVDLVVKAGLADTLSGAGPFTVFAPDNNAFAKLPKSLVDALTSDVELLKKVLLYHVVPGVVKSRDITDGLTAASAEGSDLRANVYYKSKYGKGYITVNGKAVKYPDIKASNGIIHIIKDVIYPIPSGNIAEVVSGDERFSTLLAAVGAAGLADILATGGPFTVFAPTNEAFAKVPKDVLNGLLSDKEALTKVLLRHVVPGTKFAKGLQLPTYLQTAGGAVEDRIGTMMFRSGTVKVFSAPDGKQNVAKVVTADIIATNGVIHAIDTVI